MATDTETVQALTSNPHLFGDRILQQLTLFVGGGYVFYLLLSVPLVTQSAKVMHPWWTAIALVLTFGTGITMGLQALRTTGSQLRVAAACASIGYVIAVLLWPLGWNGGTADIDTLWIQTFVGLPALAAASTWPAWVPFAYLFSSVVAVQVINDHVRTPSHSGTPIAEAAWTFAFCLVPVAAAVMAVRSARLLDATRETSLLEASDNAARHARSAERTRLNALTHDGVMTTLLMAARQGRTATVAQQAAATLTDMKNLAHDIDTANFQLAAPAVVARIRSAVANVDPRQLITVNATHQPGTRYPAEAAVTIAAACAEAVRNSTRHAGADATRTVTVNLDEGTITVAISDNGPGFDPDTVPQHRFGIAVSIRQRMAHLRGGSASIVSTPGEGTVVVLTWKRQQ